MLRCIFSLKNTQREKEKIKRTNSVSEEKKGKKKPNKKQEVWFVEKEIVNEMSETLRGK